MSESNSVQLNVEENSSKDQPASNSNSSEKQLRLVDIEIDSENTALNVLIGFLSVAQKRGTFLFDESAKINDCIKVFMKPNPTTSE